MFSDQDNSMMKTQRGEVIRFQEIWHTDCKSGNDSPKRLHLSKFMPYFGEHVEANVQPRFSRLRAMRRRVPGSHHQMGAQAWKYLQEYCSKTTLHGVRYMVEEGRPLRERIWWVIAFSVSFIMCALLINQVWKKWNTSPVIVTFAQAPTPVWTIPFPAVTVCPEVICRKDLFNFSKAYENLNALNATELNMFYNMVLLCQLIKPELSGPMLMSRNTLINLRAITSPVQDIIKRCTYIGKPMNCSEIFVPILTGLGICYSFNLLDSKDIFTDNMSIQMMAPAVSKRLQGWSAHGGYTSDSENTGFPKRAIGVGIHAAFRFDLVSYSHDFDYICRTGVPGFKVLLHPSTEFPCVRQKHFMVGVDTALVTTVVPDMMTTASSLVNYSPTIRQCYFPGERLLHYYRIYTQLNCNLECLANITFQLCNCVSFEMPHERDSPVCGIGKQKCLAIVHDTLIRREIGLNFSQERSPLNSSIFAAHESCNCLPACNHISYSVRLSQAEFKWRSRFHANNMSHLITPGKQLTSMTIFFEDWEFISSQRNELYGPTEFVANCGGLLGLFLGFSVLSLFEIVYFLTLRLLCKASTEPPKLSPNRIHVC